MSFFKKGFFDVPKVLQIEVTNKCPFKCVECYKHEQTSEMHIDTFKSIVDEAVRLDIKAIMLNGGEPLIAEHLKDMIDYVDNRIPLTMFTSGYSLNKSWLDFFKKYNLNLYISLNGSSNEIDSLSRDSFKEATFAMSLLNQESYPYYLNWVARNDNIYDFPKLIQKAKEMGAVGINIVGNKIDGNKMIQSPLTMNDYELLIYIIKMEKEDKFISIQRCFGLLSQAINKNRVTVLDGCQAGISACAIMTDGTFQPCTHLCYPEKHSSINSYWNKSPTLAMIRANKPKKILHCMNCLNNDNCSFCRAISKTSHDNLDVGYEDCLFFVDSLV